MSESWRQQGERGSGLMMQLLLWCAQLLGRPLTRLLLWPIAGYFLLAAPAPRRASRAYLRRVLGSEPGWREVARHFHTFAAVSLDRFFLLGGNPQQFDVRLHCPPEVDSAMQQAGGSLMLLAHHGGYEALRLAGAQRRLPLRILMDLAHGRKLMALLQKLNPALAAQVIDASERGPQLVLKLKEALQQGAVIGTMADRADAERAETVQFLGAPARLPAGPWILAAMLGVPVILAFGLYRGGKRYDLHFELFTAGVSLPRAQREAALRACMQDYAARLEHYVRLAPYNWFNFYEFWSDEAAAH